MQAIKSARVQYKPTHPIYPSEASWDSWMVLCEDTIELAEAEAKRRLMPALLELSEKIADEMIATVEEYDAD